MDWLQIILDNTARWGAFSIAVATVIAVIINLLHSKNTERRHRRESDAAFSSAIASELIDNAHNLMALYPEILEAKANTTKITGYKQFNTLVYEHNLAQIGKLGASLSFLTVDVYGDIQKLKSRLNFMDDMHIKNEKEDILYEIQTILVKTISASIVLFFYADFLSGKKWLKTIKSQRLIWVQRTIDDFCQYIDTTDQDINFISAEENMDMEFIKRFEDRKDRKQINALYTLIAKILDTIAKQKRWGAQLMLRALSYKIQNSLTFFLEIEPHRYDVMSEDQYEAFLPKVKA